MKNSILSIALLGAAIVGGIIGGNINDIQRNAEVEAAWSNVVVVDNGTLVANPAYFALHPEELGREHRVIISDLRGAGITRLEMVR